MPTVQPIIATPNLDRMKAFYERLLGAVETTRYPADGPVFFVNLALGDSEIGLVSEADTDISTTPRIVLSIVVDDVDALLKEVEAAGGSIFAPPNDMPWGQRVLHVYDPDRNMINLAQPIPPR